MKILVLLFAAILADAMPQAQTATSGLAVTPPYLSFSAPGGASPDAKSIAITMSTAGPWTASVKAPWLSLSQTSGSGPATVPVSVQTGGMLPGYYSDVITVTSSGVTASVAVTLAVPVARGTAIVTGNYWYVSPSGTPNGDGSIGKPWDIITAFNNPSHAIRPGDTVWMRDGKYGDGGPAIIESHLVGTPSAPIIVRAYPGERPIIDNWLQVLCCNGPPDSTKSAYTWYWGLEFASYNPDRSSSSTAQMANHAAVDVFGTGVKIINCIVHDTSGGISMWQEAPNSEAYGNIVYNVGGYGPDRGHGHGFYLQNAAPAYKHIVDNISFNNFGNGLQMYGSNATYVQNFHVEGNIAINNGTLATGNNTANGTAPAGPRNDNLLISSGNGGPSGIVLIGNYTYHTPMADDGYNDMSYASTPVSNDLTAIGNYFIGGNEAVEFFRWNSIFFQKNSIYSAHQDDISLFWRPEQNPATYAWDNNQYFGSGRFTVYNGCVTFTCSNGRTLDFGTWKSENGIDANSTFTAGPPKGVWMAVRPNLYEPGRANIVIYNWDLLSTVQVDLSTAGVQSGDQFEIRDAENWFGGAIVSGTYSGGTVTIPMTGLQVALPNGVVPNPQPHTAPQFGVFVVLSQSSVAQGRKTGVHRPVQQGHPR